MTIYLSLGTQLWIIQIVTFSGLYIRVHNYKLIFLFFNQNICCGYSKEPSQRDGSFVHPKHMLKLIGKKILTIYFKNVFILTCAFLQNPNIHHPKTIALSLQHEKIIGISACSVRASVYTESDKVATWIDDTLTIVAQKLEHSAQSFPEFQSDKIASLHTCSLFTCARLESGALYWW